MPPIALQLAPQFLGKCERVTSRPDRLVCLLGVAHLGLVGPRLIGQELLPLSEAPARADGTRRRGRLVELHESAAIEKIIAELARKGLKVDHYAASDRPIFELIEGEGEKSISHPLFSIPEILQKILEIGRRGVQIKRFKGLGEMNAKELFETTMNPEKRKLLKVDLNEDNAVDADKMFTRLMGDLVEPRRQYIEDNALNVRNLDV